MGLEVPVEHYSWCRKMNKAEKALKSLLAMVSFEMVQLIDWVKSERQK